MIWNAPAALAGLLLLAGPLLVHLLIRSHARRVLFPAMHFVPHVRAAAVRLRRPSDPGLLALRLSVIAAAVLATAQPVLVTPAREAAWNARTVRAVAVDTSASVPAVAGELAEQAARGAFASRRFAGPDLRDALRRAIDWLRTAPAGRREVTIVSDFQRGSIDGSDVASIPADAGVHLLRAGAPSAPSSPMRGAEGWRAARWMPALTLDPSSTAVIWTRQPATPSAAVTIRAAADDSAAAARAEQAAHSFGVPDAEPSRRIEIAFAGAPASTSSSPVTPWIANAAISLLGNSLIAESGATLKTGERDGALIVQVSVRAASPAAPSVIRAVLLAAAPTLANPELEPAALDEAVLSRWRREPAPRPDAVRPDVDDGRWLWAIALMLLVVEEVVRRRPVADVARESHADAA